MIEDFLKEFKQCLEFIFSAPNDKIPANKKLEFFAETRHAFGRTALMFSGGAGMGLYHFGVFKGLFEQNLVPRIVAGSSVGSLIAGVFCTRKIEEIPKVKLN